MIVVDASIVVEFLTHGSLAAVVDAHLTNDRSEAFLAPHLLDVEVASALRGMAKGRVIDPHTAAQLLSSLAAFPAERFEHAPLLPRIWELRNNFTAYDAAYIALAEAFGATLWTSDEKLRKGHRAQVRYFAPTAM